MYTDTSEIMFGLITGLEWGYEYITIKVKYSGTLINGHLTKWDLDCDI